LLPIGLTSTTIVAGMSTAAHPRLRIAATAALVCGAYLIGARLGEELRFPTLYFALRAGITVP
jgi:hypothetical protein